MVDLRKNECERSRGFEWVPGHRREYWSDKNQRWEYTDVSGYCRRGRDRTATQPFTYNTTPNRKQSTLF